MGIIDLFSRRGKSAPDVYQYTTLPQALRIQVYRLIESSVGEYRPNWWRQTATQVAAEHGLTALPTELSLFERDHDYFTDCMNYVLHADFEKAMDMIEVCFRAVAQRRPNFQRGLHLNPDQISPAQAIEELNHRFRMHGVGYQFESDQFVRVDSQLIHAETVVPALRLLSDSAFAGPNKEFLNAHEHFRHGRYEVAVAEANKAFESTMKTICSLRGWPYDKNKATAKDLINVIIQNKLVDAWGQEQLLGLDKCLQGLPTLRNKTAGHGGGPVVRDLPERFAAYALHLAATNIVFLVESYKALA